MEYSSALDGRRSLRNAVNVYGSPDDPFINASLPCCCDRDSLRGRNGVRCAGGCSDGFFCASGATARWNIGVVIRQSRTKRVAVRDKPLSNNDWQQLMVVSTQSSHGVDGGRPEWKATYALGARVEELGEGG